MKLAITILAVLATSSIVHAKHLPRLVSASVMVKLPDGSGSGVAYHNQGHVFIWTDAHVVSNDEKIYYPSPLLQQELIDNGEKIGWTSVFSEVIRYSKRHDIAVLRVKGRSWPRGSVEFADDIPRVGTRCWHVGSMFGTLGMNSVSEGVLAAVGRLRRDFVPNETRDGIIYDQLSLTAYPGSSGGGVFRQSDGKCLGLITEFLKTSPGAVIMSPTRRLREFAREARCEWATDRRVAVPTRDDGPIVLDK